MFVEITSTSFTLPVSVDALKFSLLTVVSVIIPVSDLILIVFVALTLFNVCLPVAVLRKYY